jgi:hypothetical protein
MNQHLMSKKQSQPKKKTHNSMQIIEQKMTYEFKSNNIQTVEKYTQ